MADATFVPDYLNTSFFEEVMQNGLRELNVKVTHVIVTKISAGGENYCSNIYRASVNFQRPDKKEKEKISLIVKSMPVERQGILGRLQIYTKETSFYMDLKPQMDMLMWKKPAWELGAKHFYSTADPEQTIVVEDLNEKGYFLKERQIGLDEQHCSMVLRKLAQYHALSMAIVYKDECTAVRDRFPYGILVRPSIEAPAFKSLFGAQLLKLTSILSEWEGFENITKKLHKYYENFTQKIIDSVYPMEGAFNVLNHGDLWVNNLLFQPNPDGTPRDVRFIDFQLGYYGSLGFDFNYFFYTSVQLDVMERKRDDLIKIYHTALAETLDELRYHQVQPTLEDVKKEILRREPFGFFVSFGFFPMMTMQGEDSKDNSLEKFHDKNFAEKKIELMFLRNKRTLETLRYSIKRFDELGVFD